jgi:predicted short-subunit dehydrogenase-like oxidoreductase (DUF2520 family)
VQVCLIGPGRLGRSLAPLLRAAGHDVALRGRGELPGPCDVVWLTVPDRALAEVAAWLAPQVGATPVLHASGALDLTPLAALPEHGSLHPLMTFPGPEVGLPDLQGVPAALDGTPAAHAVAAALASSLGLRPLTVRGDRRLYHAAAVLAGNLSTVLLTEAARVLVAAGVPPDEAAADLLPLALASLRNAARRPDAALTGPIARGDLPVLSAHRAALTAAGLTDLVPWYDESVAVTSRMVTRLRARSND